MEDKKSLFEKYKIVKDDEGTIVENKETEEPVTQPDQPKEIVLPSVENNEEDFFEYNFKDDEEINEIVNSVLGKEEPVVPENEPVSMTVAPLVVTEEKEEPKQVKEKKVKEPKPPKEKKVKEPKPPKEKKEKGELAEPVTKKDYITIVLALVAVVLAMAFVVVKYLPMDGSPTSSDEQTTVAEQDLAKIQVSREGSLRNYVQSDIPNVFYMFSSDYGLQYYQYRDNQMVPVKSTGTLSASVNFGPAKLPVTIDYVKVGEDVFGVGLFRPDQHQNINLFNIQLIMFKLTNMPKGYGSSDDALLVAKITSAADLEKEYDRWTESYTVNLSSGKCSRFLSVASRETDPTTGTYVEDFCVLTTEGYNATNGKVPYLSGRNYDMSAGKDDIFIKSGNNEKVAIKNIANKMLLVDGDAVIFMRYTETGFNVYKYADGKESVVFEFTGSTNRCIFADEYILDKEKGTLYNLKTGKETLLVGYKMTSPEIMKVSPDGKYLVVMGIMDNVMDYQVHVYNIQTGEYAKYQEENYSNVNNLSKNLSFIDDHTVMYMLADPNRGRECVILDLSKAFE
ncbi:MAG: hypothetical protein J6B37_01800 [Clostridia bacterium]|nr:hypothetical protein [Clostridia bacterium]